jgi:hypothetical protein
MKIETGYLEGNVELRQRNQISIDFDGHNEKFIISFGSSEKFKKFIQQVKKAYKDNHEIYGED